MGDTACAPPTTHAKKVSPSYRAPRQLGGLAVGGLWPGHQEPYFKSAQLPPGCVTRWQVTLCLGVPKSSFLP